MNRTENEEYIIGCVSLLSNKITQFGDSLLPDITFRQWFLLMMISKMEQQEKNINSIAEFVGTTRQNVKKLLTPLENKGYVLIKKSSSDARALNVELTEKTYQYFSENDEPTACETNKLFIAFSTEEINNLICALNKLLCAFEAYGKDSKNNE
ncbi:MAG: winged helix DNA-binding protein [Lachnospiraceae bacterium]|nr:winged helix DNA-binding protein [Lachnospiraceae bacterium]MDE6981723.1 winged helix DNA-binding protein [Lachnospiraceae bacterium]